MQDFIKQVDEMTVLELNNLVKALEDHYGVSAAAAAMRAPTGSSRSILAYSVPGKEKAGKAHKPNISLRSNFSLSQPLHVSKLHLHFSASIRELEGTAYSQRSWPKFNFGQNHF